jgi:hypothetical protein
MVEAQCEAAASTPSAVPPAGPTPPIASPSPSPAATLHPGDSSSSFECQLPSSPQIMAKAPAVLIVVRYVFIRRHPFSWVLRCQSFTPGFSWLAAEPRTLDPFTCAKGRRLPVEMRK